MKTLDLNIYYGEKYGTTVETDATDIEFSDGLYNKIKEYYIENGEVTFSDLLEYGNLTKKQEQELNRIMEDLKQECIDNDDSYWIDDEDYDDEDEEEERKSVDASNWRFTFEVIAPDDWDE